ncbi:MAG: 3-hydroxy-5-phosphonooxypentane-2,4-dione thiolase [Kiritimatiellia bacterium]
MADLDDLRDGAKFGEGVAQKAEGFFLKGCNNLDWGMKDRMSRIFNPESGRSVMLAFDHGFIMGPTSGVERIDLTILPLIEHADCLMCARGILRALVPPSSRKPICLRSDAGSSILTDLNHNVIIDVQDAARLNASAMAVMVSIGDADTEALTVSNLYNAVDAGQAYGIPVMGVTAVGKTMVRDARYFALASRICAENGANIVKTYYTEGFDKVVACCPVPIVIAGGKKLPELEALELAYMAVQAGAAGVDMGRNVFQSDAPAAMLQAVGAVVHKDMKPVEAFQMYNDLSFNASGKAYVF